jgi:SAM-dependent methyltransferase
MNPEKTLAPYVAGGATAADVGCGPGFHVEALARLVGEGGRVLAVDIQQCMLDRVRRKLDGSGLAGRVVLHRCGEEALSLPFPVDFALLVWSLHEMPSPGRVLAELRDSLNTGGRILVAEPRGHVNRREFEEILTLAEREGLVAMERPRVWGSRAVLLALAEDAEGRRE